MNKIGGSGLVVAAIILVAIGLTLRWDLIDWLIDAVGFLFIVAGIGVGVAGVVRLLSGREKAAA